MQLLLKSATSVSFVRFVRLVAVASATFPLLPPIVVSIIARIITAKKMITVVMTIEVPQPSTLPLFPTIEVRPAFP
jgi:hypothetical protein